MACCRPRPATPPERTTATRPSRPGRDVAAVGPGGVGNDLVDVPGAAGVQRSLLRRVAILGIGADERLELEEDEERCVAERDRTGLGKVQCELLGGCDRRRVLGEVR